MAEIAGRDEKGKPLTEEEVAERTKKKLEEDEKAHEDVREELKEEAEEAVKAAEDREKADKEFLKKQEKAEEKETAKASHPQQGQSRAAPAR